MTSRRLQLCVWALPASRHSVKQHQFSERGCLFWTQSSPFVVQDRVEIVGRDNIIPTGDAAFDEAPDVFDGLYIGYVRTLEQEIYALHLGELAMKFATTLHI